MEPSAKPPRSARAGLLVMALLGAGCSTPTIEQEPSINRAAKHVVVTFTDDAVQPETAEVDPGGSVVWINDTSFYLAAVYFDASVRDKFTCKELRPKFYEVSGGYQSITIEGAEEAVTLPCPLRPGSYSYEIRLFNSEAGNPEGRSENPVARMPGRIVVQ